MAFLIMLASAGLVGSFRSPPVVVTEAQLEKVSVSIGSFRFDCQRLPDDLADLASSRDSTAMCWKGPYLSKKAVVDFWGNKLDYHVYGDGKLFSLRSIGVDQVLGSNDDIVLGDRERSWRSFYPSSVSSQSDVSWWLKLFIALFSLSIVVIAVVRMARRRKSRREL
ncbi:type II secretion system protein GspG [Tahibacter aquaticus]|uniref:type II secretion system protein GspG n=1 Tax=Tahibacter aquaticus TaxID=520092 RepID=UPI001414DB08|nr:type II secretion system protein GspG [Tahibacter aquaticus]